MFAAEKEDEEMTVYHISVYQMNSIMTVENSVRQYFQVMRS